MVGGVVEPCFPAGAERLARFRRFWSVLPQARGGRPFVHATSNVLLDLAALRGLAFDEAHGLSGGGDLVFFSRLFERGVAMAWAELARVREEVPRERASLAWLARRRRRVGNHMVMDEEARQGRLRPVLKTLGLLARLPAYPLLGREPGARLARLADGGGQDRRPPRRPPRPAQLRVRPRRRDRAARRARDLTRHLAGTGCTRRA